MHQPKPRGPSGFAAFLPIVDLIVPYTATDGRAFARIPAAASDAYSNLAVRSREFREWFFARSYDEFETIPTAHAWNAIRHHLEAQAGRHPHTLQIRVPRRVDSRGDGPLPAQILLDLANPEGQFVEISAEGWQTTAREGVPFETSRHTASLPAPQPPAPDSFEILRSALNLRSSDPGDWHRSLAWLLSALRPGGPYPVLILRGPTGSGKSFAARILRALVDPSMSPLTPIPPSARDLLSLARHSWVLAFDHVSSLTPQFSDALCRLSSGVGIACREEGHRDPAQLWIKRPIILTVTDDFAPRPDLAARALTVNLPALTPETRRAEDDLLAAFDAAFPQILGALCDAISTALRSSRQSPTAYPTRHTSLRDWAAAAADALRCTPGEMRRSLDVPPPSHPFVEAVLAFSRRFPHWTGTATDLLTLLPLGRPPAWISAQLKKHALALADAGIQLDFHRQHGGTRIITLSSSPDLPASLQTTPPAQLISTPEVPPAPPVCVTAIHGPRPTAPAAEASPTLNSDQVSNTPVEFHHIGYKALIPSRIIAILHIPP